MRPSHFSSTQFTNRRFSVETTKPDEKQKGIESFKSLIELKDSLIKRELFEQMEREKGTFPDELVKFRAQANERVGSLIDGLGREGMIQAGQFLSEISRQHSQNGDFEEAMITLRKSLLLSWDAQNTLGCYVSCFEMGDVLCKMEEYDDSNEAFSEALKHARNLDDLGSQFLASERIGKNYRLMGIPEAAVEMHQASIEIASRSYLFDYEIDALLNKYQCLKDMGDPYCYASCMTRLNHLLDSQSQEEKTMAMIGLGRLYLMEDDPERAKTTLEVAVNMCISGGFSKYFKLAKKELRKLKKLQESSESKENDPDLPEPEVSDLFSNSESSSGTDK